MIVSMIVIAILGFMAGLVLAQRFTVLVLVPAGVLALLGALLFGMANIPPSSVILGGVLAIVTLNLGYFASIAWHGAAEAVRHGAIFGYFYRH